LNQLPLQQGPPKPPGTPAGTPQFKPIKPKKQGPPKPPELYKRNNKKV